MASRYGITVRKKEVPAAYGRVATQSIAQPSVIATTEEVPTIRLRPSDVAKYTQSAPVIRLIPPLIIPPKKQYEQDTLNVSQFQILNNTFEPVQKNGISVFRPEILSMMDFKPIDGSSALGSDNQTEAAEQLLKAQYQAIELRAITLQKLMGDIRSRANLRPALDGIKNQYVNGLNSTKTALRYMGNLVDKIEEIKSSLDPKKIPERAYDTSKFLSLDNFYERRMQYPKGKYENFSDTKVLNQLISDFRYILEGHSLSLLDLVDVDRQTDTSPVVLDKTYTQNSGFTFTVSSIRSETVSKKANSPSFFTSFLNSLPSNSDDRIKLLIHVLSKELRVSRQLGQARIAQTLRQKFNQEDTGNPFDNILGIPGDTIFDAPLGANSLSSLTFLQLPNNVNILPFESLYVDGNNQHTYVPGSSYLVDSILNGSNNTFNTQPFVDFGNRFSETLSSVQGSIETLLELSPSRPSGLAPTKVYDLFLASLEEATAGLGFESGMNRGQAICVALFRLATTNMDLKNQLFEYLLLTGLASMTSSEQRPVFERLAREAESIQNFSFIHVSRTATPDLLGGVASLRPYIEKLAKNIEDQVFALVNSSPVALSGLIRVTSPASTPVHIARPVLGGLGDFRSTTVSFPFTRGEIKETLVNSVTAVGNASTNLCKEFVDLAIKLDQLASTGANASHLLPDGTGRTRFNFLSTSTQLLLVFETLSALASRYTFADFNQSPTPVDGSITVDTSTTSGISRIIKEQTKNIQLQFSLQNLAFVPFKNTLSSNRTRLSGEDLIVRNILHIFSMLGQRLATAKATALSFFTPTSLDNIMRTTGIGVADLQLVRNPSQVRVSTWLLDRYDERTSDVSNTDETEDSGGGFLITDRVPTSQLNALFLMLNQGKYQYKAQADLKVKLLTVGLPAGFTRKLSDRISQGTIREANFKDKEFDVIAIDVYKRDTRYDDIVFKPQRFIFDLSLFPIRNFLPPGGAPGSRSQDMNYGSLQRRVIFRDYQSPQNKRSFSLADTTQNERYSFLSDGQKQQMMRNHLESQLFDLYIRLMTGFRMDEETFTETLYDKSGLQDQAVFNLALRFLREVKNKTVPNVSLEELLKSTTLDQETKDILRLLSHGNIVFQPQFVQKRILEPKLFDRVFHLPVNIDEFPIDVKATISTESGRETYRKNTVQEQLVRIGDEEYFRSRDRNNLVMEDYFVVVETDLRGEV